MRRILGLLVSLIHLSGFIAEAQEPEKDYSRYVTRPDIEPATWRIEINDEANVAPGYWFVSPYEKNGYRLPGRSWIGPHIYDGKGELVWSGSYLFDRRNVMDFKVMNVLGSDMLSMLFAVEGSAYLLDDDYQVRQKVFTGETGVVFNMHDFHSVDDGTKYLFLQRNITEASQQMSMDELGFDGKCKVTFPGFEERDVRTEELLHKWDGTGNIPLSDSTMAFAAAEDRCRSYWDYLHSNAIDKFADGNYLISTRHSDTIYKISKDDGSIMWRLHGHGGQRSDFEMGNLNFSRQHHARIHAENDTHTILTFLDNAVGADPQPATSECSRALTVALRTDVTPMTAEMIASYEHPKGKHAFRRGSYQILPNGNVFVGWSERALQSEHTPDGKVVMLAELETKKLGTYRAFKFPWVAKPDYPPDVWSGASNTNSGMYTQVYVSWNGATEVDSWDLYKTDQAGKRSVKLSSETKSGFETSISYDGYAKYVYVEGLDKNGESLGKSEIFETKDADDMLDSAVAAELAWLQEGQPDDSNGQDDHSHDFDQGMDEQDDQSQPHPDNSSQQQQEEADSPNTPNQASWLSLTYFTNSTTMFIAGIICGAIAFFVMICARRRIPWLRRRGEAGPSYQRVAAADAWEFDEASLDEIRRNRQRNAGVHVLADDDEEDDEGSGSGSGHGRTPSTGNSSAG